MAVPLVKQLVNLHRRQIFGVIEVRGVGRMNKLYADSRAELEDKLAKLKRAGKGQTFGAQHLRLVLAQVADTVRGFEGNLADHMRDTGAMAATLAPRQVVSMIDRMEAKFGRMTPVIQAQQAAVLRGVYPKIAPSLLDRNASSVRTYGPQTIRAIREGLARSIIQGEDVDEAVGRVEGTDGLFAGQRWRAERIVRTELAYTTGFATQKSIEELSPAVPKLMKRLVATDDDREGDDSVELDGQTVAVDEPFVWVVKNSKGIPTGKVVRYMHPPNRPHDREVEIPWLMAWGGPNTPVASPGEVDPTVPRNLDRRA